MTYDDELASVRRALAEAERARDEALAAAAAVQQRWQDERREEHHRLRNLFSVIRAIVHRTGDDVETVEDYCGVLDGRFSAYLRTQASVMQDWSRGADLALLLGEALQTFGLKEGERVTLTGQPIRLTSQAAGILALTFHELAFGAVLSDPIADPRSDVRIAWRLNDGGATHNLLIDWVDATSGEEADDDQSSSWTDWVEQAIRYQLAGTLTREGGSRRSTRICLPGSALCP